MRSPGRKRPQKRAVAVGIPQRQLDACALTAEYVGSVEHKDYPSFAGPAHPRSDATKCPRHLADGRELTNWLREAIRKGYVSKHFNGAYPRYVWIVRGPDVYEARITNEELGQYKGYPLAPGERPTGID